MDAISLYSGADNLGDGIIQAGHKIKLAIDIDQDCCKTIKLNHPDTEVICGKVSDHLSSLPKCDALVGGPPCQGFSIANHKRNLDLTEINNFKKARTITKCKYYFMENVRGISKVLHDDNYLINTSDYGIPQTRIRRIFTNLPLPKPTHCNNWVTMSQALKISNGIIHNRRQLNDNIKRNKLRFYTLEQPSVTITTDTRLWLITDEKFQNYSYKQRKYFHELHKPARTITTKDLGIQASMMISNGIHARKLNISELAILQGFRKNFQFYGTKTSIRKQIGNALPAIISKKFFEKNSL